MSDDRFEAFLTALARARTRREMLAAVAVSTSAAVVAGAEPAAGQAATCGGSGSRCQRGAGCCSGRCRKRRGKKIGRCRCSREGGRCRLGTDDCCGGELFCSDGFCVFAAD